MIEMNIIEDLYYSGFRQEKSRLAEDAEYARLWKTVFDSQEILEKSLHGEEKHLFSRLINSQKGILEAESLENFLEGWRLGARFMLDTFFGACPKAMGE